jgi:predicted RNA-binding protein with PUA-like domain
MKYWLMKSEPSAYSWQQLLADKRTPWNGVRNYTARNNMQAMQVGDRAFFYHSNEGVEIVGLMEIVRTAYPDPSDDTGKFVMVDVKPLQTAATPLTLATIKADATLQNMQLVKQSRLSVSAVTEKEYKEICKRCGFKA